MIEPFAISIDRLLDSLRTLCALPGSPGQPDELTQVAAQVATLMRQLGLDTELVATDGAPVVIGRRAGRAPFTLLLYHHYDVAPPGRWLAWNHEPYQLAERDALLYGRGVATGKGPLAAHLAALATLLDANGELPCGVVVVVEGEALAGSAGLGTALSKLREQIHADACLATSGDRNATGQPICYSGAKGQVQVRLSVSGANQPLSPGLSASVPNPLWRLIWALGQIKNEQEEVLIGGFYDNVEGPDRDENRRIRAVKVDEAARLAAWGLDAFLAEASGASLMRIEATLPTCNVSAISVEPHAHLAAVPTSASALLDFQLVPSQQPEQIVELLRQHLDAKDLPDVSIEQLSGGYAAAHVPLDGPFIADIVEAARALYGAPLDRLPFGPFALPLAQFANDDSLPIAVIGCTRPDNAIYGPNEHILLDDLVQHGQLLVELLKRCGQAVSSDGEKQ